jgi:hypothetical protein
MPPDPQKIVNIIASPGQSARVNTLRQVLGEGVWQRVQSLHLAMTMQRVTSTGEAGKPVVDGMKLLNHLMKPENASVFRAVHGEGSDEALRQIGQMLAARKGVLSPQALRPGAIQTTLQTLRNNEKALDDYLKNNLLSELRDPRKTGEDVFRWAVEPGKESRIMEVARQFGEDSPQMAELRQAGMEMLARNANIKAIVENGTGAIDRALNEFTEEQRKLLSPGGMEKDLRAMQDVIKYMFPLKSDVGMAGMHAGSVLEQPLFGGKKGFFAGRLYKQAMAATMRLLVQHPTVARWLVTGRSKDTPWIAETARVLKQIAKMDTIEEDPMQPEVNREHDPQKSMEIAQANNQGTGDESNPGSGSDNPDPAGVPAKRGKPQGQAGNN